MSDMRLSEDASHPSRPARHSPGPWRACHEGKCSCGQVWSQTADHPVAVVTRGPWGDTWPSIRVNDAGKGMAGSSLNLEASIERMDYGSVGEAIATANARLISAAPDMLLALKAMTEEWVDYMTINNLAGDPWAKHNMRLAKLAIEKAEGRKATGEQGEAKRSTP